MVERSFAAVMRSIFRSEGSYVDHPDDPGGATNRGITRATLSAFLGRPASRAEVRGLTEGTAARIYRERYWDRIAGDALPAGVDLCVMDAAVNSGPSRAVRWAARAVVMAAPKRMTPDLVVALGRAPAARTVNRMMDDRLAWLRRLSHWPTFGRGWTRRIRRVRILGLRA